MTDGPVSATLTAYPDGPLLVRAPYRLVDADGAEIPTTRRTVALCRCGRSRQKPWCDSSHKLVRRAQDATGPTPPTKDETVPMTTTQTIAPTRPERWEPPLPSPRGPVTEMLVARLAEHPGELPPVAVPAGDPLTDEDLNLALYLCYELHYRGYAGVDPGWEWHPPLLALRARLEAPFEAALRERFFDDTCRDQDVRSGLRRIADRPGPSLSRFLKDSATAEQFLEVVVHRSGYRLKEADPHAFAIPRLTGPAKAALVEIEFDEFGSGRPDRIHAGLYRESMHAMGLDSRYGAYLDAIPGVTLATVNAMSLFGLHRRLRGAIVGHLAIAEMTSALANKRQADGLRRLGYSAEATEFSDEHVIADSVHDLIALNDMAGGLAADEPELAADILFGAAAATGLDNAFAEYVLARWAVGQSSLRMPITVPCPLASCTTHGRW